MDLQLEFLIYTSLSSTHYNDKEWYGTRDHGSPYNMTFEEYTQSTYDPADLAMVFHGSYERSGGAELYKRSDAATKWYEYFSNK